MNNDHYVYIHRRKDNNVVFYVGHGRLVRAHQGSKNKTKDWEVIESEAGGHLTEILHDNLSKIEAIEIECDYITNPAPDWELVNKRKPTKVNSLDFNHLNSMFYYDETSSTCLRYKTDRIKNKGAVSKAKDSEVGNIKYLPNGNPRGYRVKLTNLQGLKEELMVHRIVWVLVNGSIDNTLVIDHIDGNPLNNKISNLRQVTYEQNARNKSAVLSDKSTLILNCVRLNEVRCRVTLTNSEGLIYSKSYSVNKYGKEDAILLALKSRLENLDELESNGVVYTDRHSDKSKVLELIQKLENK